MNAQVLLPQIREQIARDELAEALEQLRQLLANSPKLDEIIHQSGRFENIRRQIRLGTVSHQDATLTENQIRAGLLELVSEIEAQGHLPAVSAEIERAASIVHSKNVVADSTITAGGAVHIGDKTTTVTQNADKIYNINHLDNAHFS